MAEVPPDTVVDVSRRTWLRAGALASVIGLIAVWLLVSANHVELLVEHPGYDGERIVVIDGSGEPVRLVVKPGRKVDATRVTLDGAPAPHPVTDEGEALEWDPSGLRPGAYVLEVTIPRPAWFALVRTIPIVVVSRG